MQNRPNEVSDFQGMRLTASQTHILHAVASSSCSSCGMFFWMFDFSTNCKKFILWMLLIGFSTSPAYATFWSYDGQRTGQGDWGDLDPAFVKCGSGIEQSPISIGVTSVENLPALTFEYNDTKTSFTLDRYSVVATPSTALQFAEGKNRYRLKEMLIRTPSEHDVHGNFYPMEIQLFHESDDKKLLMVSVFIQSGEPNSALQSIIDHFPKKYGEKTNADLSWPALLPSKTDGYYAYRGSLATPPCTEGMEIRILKIPVEASSEQLQWLASKLKRNARNAQPILIRKIRESKE